MFLRFFGLREQPFGVTPDPRFLFATRVYREALASLQYGLQENRGFMALIASPGMGKTTLLFQLLEQLRPATRTAFLFHTQCNSLQMLSSIVADLECDPEKEEDASLEIAPKAATDIMTLQQSLNRLLIGESKSGRTPVVVIDEAQNLEDSVLETVRLLSDFETPTSKLVQIVLAGQTELGERLAQPQLSQLRQRISIISRLSALDAAEVVPYIESRLQAAGYVGADLFTPQAYRRIAQLSGGIPRNINNLCFHSLSLACAQELRKVDLNVLSEVEGDLNWNTFTPAPANAKAAASAASSKSEANAAVSKVSVSAPVSPAMQSRTPIATPQAPKPAASTATVHAAATPPHMPAAQQASPAAPPQPRPQPVEQQASRAQSAPPRTNMQAVQAKPVKPPATSQSRYGIPVVVFLIVLLVGILLMVWSSTGDISSLLSPNARAATTDTITPAAVSSPEADKAQLLHSGSTTPREHDSAIGDNQAADQQAPAQTLTVTPAETTTELPQPAESSRQSAHRHHPVSSDRSSSNDSLRRRTDALVSPEVMAAPLTASRK